MRYTTICNTQSSASEDGRDHRPKHVELIGIINKQLMLHLFDVYIIYVNDARSNKYQISKLTKYAKNKSCNKLVSFTRLRIDARSTGHTKCIQILGGDGN